MRGPDLSSLPGAALLAGEPGVHAVGGAVRDLLLGREPVELDAVVEGDAVALARRLARGAPVTAHERFGTATLRLPEGGTLDLASARRERYPRPGALPEVELGASLAEDLARRDFTVNAIAAPFAPGAVIAVPHALEDLEAGVLRVLHPASFADDPTRVLRLARYAARLGFAPDPATAALARDAVLTTASPTRLGAELRLLLREPQPAGFVALGATHGATLLGAAFTLDPLLVARAAALAPADARADLVALAAVCGPEPGERLRELGFPARDVARVERPGSVERMVVSAARGDAAAARWLEEDRHRRLAITGDDLVAAGRSGPAVGRGLAAARAAMLDGSAPDREAQLAVALGA